MSPFDTSSAIPQDWSWKLCALVAASAVALDVLIVQSPLVWLGMAGVVAVLAQFRSPLSGLAVVLFSCGLLNYSPFESGVWARLYPGNVATGIFLLTWLISTRSWSPRSLFPPSPVRGPLLGIAIVTPLSMLWSRLYPDPEVTYNFPHSDVSWATAQVSQLVLLAATLAIPIAVAAGIRRWKDVETVVTIMGVVVAIGALLTAGGLVLGFGGSYSILGATRAYWGQPWDSSMDPLTALCLPFLYAGVLFGRRSLSHYWLICLLFVFCLVGVVLTFSRGIWVMALCGLLLVSASWLRSRLTRGSAMLVTAIVMVAIIFSGVVGLVSQFYDPQEVYGLERIYYYVTALQLFATHPLLGVGAGNYQFFDRLYEGEAAGGIAHNQFLTTAAETGLAGLALALWFVLALLKIRRQLLVPAEPLGKFPDWMKAAGSAFLLVWIAQCFFREAFFVTTAQGGGTKVLTIMVYPWSLLGVLLAASRLSQATESIDN